MVVEKSSLGKRFAARLLTLPRPWRTSNVALDEGLAVAVGRYLSPLSLLLTLGVSAPVLAQDSLPRVMLDCAREANDARRLACYDNAVAAVSAEAAALARQRAEAAARAQAEADAARKAQEAADAAAREKARIANFGAESLPAQARPDLDANIDQKLTAHLVEVLTTADKAAVFVLDNGQMWRQTTATFLPSVRPGDSVTLKRGALGAFRLVLDKSGRAYPVRRMR